MHILSFKKLREFIEKEPYSRVALQDWYKKASKAEWQNFAEIKNTFNSVGRSYYVFNVKGNHYRIVAKIVFEIRTVFIRWVGNHKDYDKIKNITEL